MGSKRIPDNWFPQQLPLCVSPDGSTNVLNVGSVHPNIATLIELAKQKPLIQQASMLIACGSCVAGVTV